jgi:hypothetical protein
LPSTLADDPVHERRAQTRAVTLLLDREEGIENSIDDVDRYARALVRHYEHAAMFEPDMYEAVMDFSPHKE